MSSYYHYGPQGPYCMHCYPFAYMRSTPYWHERFEEQIQTNLSDHGKNPFVTNIHQTTQENQSFRTAIWTGDYLQVTVMSIGVSEDIGLEVHEDHDQFLRIEQGQGLVKMGKKKEQLDFIKEVYPGSAIVVPAGSWHNIINVGHSPLKLYSIYAPPEHSFGTIHQTKADAEAAEASEYEK